MTAEPDLYADLLPIWEAAAVYGVSEARIRQWKRRGHLEPADRDADGRPLFRGIDVLRAQALAERNAARTQAVNLAGRHESVPA